ncbi:MAG: hypothetical protein JEY96_09885 [Bacteroidales bacterium]|nr:hypothetical protein [Bacteroidales bacterium]
MLRKKYNTFIVRYLILLILICSVTIGKGQTAPAADNNYLQPESIMQIHSPHKATIYSALVPGLGQIYNKKYWKLPILYGATGIFIYAFDLNNDRYHKYKNAYNDMYEGKIINFEGYTSEDVLLRLRDKYERDRNLNVIVLAAIYMLNVVDATVDAHLFDYNINDDLSLNVQPTINRTYNNQNTIGISCSFSFNKKK